MKLEWEVSRVGHRPFLRGDRLIVAKSPYNNVHVNVLVPCVKNSGWFWRRWEVVRGDVGWEMEVR